MDATELASEFEMPELSESDSARLPLPASQSERDLIAALAQERFLEISPAEQWELVAADFEAAYQMAKAGLLNAHSGKHVAVLKRQLVGADRDLTLLREKISKQFGVDPNRIAMIYMDDGSE
jgi:hypothetical protein